MRLSDSSKYKVVSDENTRTYSLLLFYFQCIFFEWAVDTVGTGY